jgi:hypothetical protein
VFSLSNSRTQFRIRDLISELCLSFGNSCLEDVNPLCQQKHNLLLIHQKVCCSLFILLPYDVLLFLSTVSRNFLVADYDIVYFSFSLPSFLSYCSSYVLRFFFLSLLSINHAPIFSLLCKIGFLYEIIHLMVFLLTFFTTCFSN